MTTHPITDYTYRLILTITVALLLAAGQTALLRYYAGTDWLPTLIDTITTAGWFAALAYLAWFVVGSISIQRTNIIITIAGILFWLAGSFMVCDIIVRIAGLPYISFASTIPFRLLFGIPAWIAILLWYHLLMAKETAAQDSDFVVPNEEKPEIQPQEECIDRITVKDGARIHIIKIEELLYVQACGDYTTLVTPSGEYIKEQTMKYLETHLPAEQFVRIHRSSIVNVTQISRLELFGKESYQLILKNGAKLRVSLSGYRLLRQRLGI